MIHKIINFLLIPFKVRYIKQTPFIHDKEFNKKWSFKSFYDVHINVGTILKPIWYENSYTRVTHFKHLYGLYKATKNVYKYMKNRPCNNNNNYNTVDLHDQLMKEGK